MNYKHSFASNQNFLDPKYSNNGELYAPQRYNQIIEECTIITKQLHTSYTDLLKISPRERAQIVNVLEKMNKAEKEALDKQLNKNKKN